MLAPHKHMPLMRDQTRLEATGDARMTEEERQRLAGVTVAVPRDGAAVHALQLTFETTTLLGLRATSQATVGELVCEL